MMMVRAPHDGVAPCSIEHSLDQVALNGLAHRGAPGRGVAELFLGQLQRVFLLGPAAGGAVIASHSQNRPAIALLIGQARRLQGAKRAADLRLPQLPW